MPVQSAMGFTVFAVLNFTENVIQRFQPAHSGSGPELERSR